MLVPAYRLHADRRSRTQCVSPDNHEHSRRNRLSCGAVPSGYLRRHALVRAFRAHRDRASRTRRRRRVRPCLCRPYESSANAVPHMAARRHGGSYAHVGAASLLDNGESWRLPAHQACAAVPRVHGAGQHGRARRRVHLHAVLVHGHFANQRQARSRVLDDCQLGPYRGMRRCRQPRGHMGGHAARHLPCRRKIVVVPVRRNGRAPHRKSRHRRHGPAFRAHAAPGTLHDARNHVHVHCAVRHAHCEMGDARVIRRSQSDYSHTGAGVRIGGNVHVLGEMAREAFGYCGIA